MNLFLYNSLTDRPLLLKLSLSFYRFIHTYMVILCRFFYDSLTNGYLSAYHNNNIFCLNVLQKEKSLNYSIDTRNLRFKIFNNIALNKVFSYKLINNMWVQKKTNTNIAIETNPVVNYFVFRIFYSNFIFK